MGAITLFLIWISSDHLMQLSSIWMGFPGWLLEVVLNSAIIGILTIFLSLL